MAILKRHEDPPELNSTIIAKTFYRCWGDKFEITLPNVFLDFWCEADLLGIRKSGYIDEIEIKVSKSDFKADFKKQCWWKTINDETRPWGNGFRRVEVKKHDMLEARDCLPNRFWFLVHPDIADKIDVPEYAGLLTVTPYKDHYMLRHIKEAPLLHKTKMPDSAKSKLFKKMAWRYVTDWQTRVS